MTAPGKFKLNASRGMKKQVLVQRGLESEETVPLTYRVTNHGPGEIYVETAPTLLGTGELCLMRNGCSIDLAVGRSNRNLLWVRLADQSEDAAAEFEFVTNSTPNEARRDGEQQQWCWTMRD